MADDDSEHDDFVLPPYFDVTVPHSARVWNYWAGGKDNYLVDREFAETITEEYPVIVDIARASRAFHVRAVRYLAHAGIRQFLDVGAGLPIAAGDSTHSIAQKIAPDSRVVYVDNDPMVAVHIRALPTAVNAGAVTVVEADARYPMDGMVHLAAENLDFTQPIAVLMSGVLSCFLDVDTVRSAVNCLVWELPLGSYLVVNEPTITHAQVRALLEEKCNCGFPLTPSTIADLFAGMRLIEPGVVQTSLWHPESESIGPFSDLELWCGVGCLEATVPPCHDDGEAPPSPPGEDS